MIPLDVLICPSCGRAMPAPAMSLDPDGCISIIGVLCTDYGPCRMEEACTLVRDAVDECAEKAWLEQLTPGPQVH